MKENFKLIPLSLSFLLIFTACGNSATQTTTEVVLTAVETSQLTPSNIERTLTYSGQATPISQINVMSKLTSKVLVTNKNVGDTVTADEVLFTLDEKDLKDQISQLEAQVNVADAAVNSAKTAYNNITGGQYESSILQLETGIAASEKQVEAAEVSLNQAKDGLALAETSYNNQKVLFEKEMLSQTAFDQVKNTYEQAKNGVIQAQIGYDNALTSLNQQKQTYEITKNQTTNDNLETAQQGVNQASASRESASLQLQLAKDTLNDLNVETPISGVVSYKGVKENEYASPSSVAYTITDMSQVLLNVKISEQLINQVYIGEEIPVKFSSIDAEVIGSIYEINPVADQTSTYAIKILINNPDNTIKPGMFAEVTFVTESAENVIVLDRSSVLTNDGANYVYKIIDGKAVTTVVELGIDNGKSVEILNGLNAGDEIITSGQDYVSDGEEVNIVSKGE